MLIQRSLFRPLALLIILGGHLPLGLSAQISTVDGYNYYDINRSAFTVDASCFDIEQEAAYEVEYWFTMLDLVKEVKTLFLDTIPSPPDKVIGDYRLVKRDFTSQKVGGEHFSWVLIRPNDEVERPVISITHGGKSGDAAHSTVLSLGVLDLVQRGYAVVFYQSATSRNGNNVEAISEANFLLECQYDWSPDDEIVCLQQAVYFRSQLSLAALQFTKSQSAAYNLSADLQYAMGFSGGGISTLYSSLMEEGDFDNDIITSLGRQNKYSLFPDTELSLKAVATLSGGMIGDGSSSYLLGNKIFQNMATDTRYLLLHGQDDNAVLPERGPLGWSNPEAAIPGSEIVCALGLDEIFKANNVPSKAIINCSGDHNLMTFPCDSNEDHFGNNPDFALLTPCTKWILPANFDEFNFADLCDGANTREAWPEVSYMLMQVHDFSKLIAFYFHEDFTNVGPARVPDSFVDTVFSTDSPASVIPIDNPKTQEGVFANGHWEMSDKCLIQSCEALYFNEEGIGDNLFYTGDYLSMNTNGFDGFNSDFTLEMEFKAIDNKQAGVLASYLRGINEGFEVLINANGFVQFRKTVGTPGSLVGTTDVQDGECHMFGLIRTGNSFQLYVDGELEDSANYAITFQNTAALRIGNTVNEQAAGKNGFNGVIRGFRIWNRSLEPDELQQGDLPLTTANLEADFTFKEFANKVYASTNSRYALQFGERESDVDYDPKWLNDDAFCACQYDIINSVGSPQSRIQEKRFTVFPNPSQGNFSVDRLEANSMAYTIQVFDSNGRQIMNLPESHHKTELRIDGSGVFLVKITSQSHSETQRVVVHR